MPDRLDIVILGATGFTGMYCIPHILQLAKSDGHNYSWGIAGRSEEKLKDVLKKMGKKVDADLAKTPLIICDVGDEESLLKMAKNTKLVINCVGPFILYGERVVEACLKAGTHHIDVSGEPHYMENLQLTKNEMAKQKGVYVISACGLDSIPSDLGLIHLEQNFEGVLNSVVTYLEVWHEGKPKGPIINYGTWASIVHGISNYGEVRKIRKALFPEKLPTFEPKLKLQMWPHKSSVVDGWVIPFPGADPSVMKRTQRYFYDNDNKRPIQINCYVVFKSVIHIILLLIMAALIFLLSKFQYGCKLLLDYPNIFSFGLFSKDQHPSIEAMDKSWFQVTFYGEGWKEKLANKNDQYSKPCDKKIVARVKGNNPGYGSTCICLVAAAITILSEKEKMAGNGKGGVYTPGAAFANTSLIKMLNENGVSFDIISESN